MTPPRERRASVLDVAKRAQVSVGTVSNVLNRPEAVAPATRERVETAIAELSFVRNGSARRLRAGKITTVGAIVLDIRNPFSTEMARGIEDRLALADHTLMLASSDDDPHREARYLRLFEEHGVVGLIVAPGSSGTSALDAVHRRGVNIVLVDAPASLAGASTVTADNEAGGAIATRHLLELGHERITMINGPHGIWQCRERLAGTRRAVTEAGLDPDRAIREITIDSLNPGGGDAAMRQLVAEGDGRPPGAVFCINDLVAIGTHRALRKLGGTALLNQVAVVGYDDLDISSELAVPLTSVRQPAQDMGRRAAELLLSPPENGGARVVFTPELIVRESSAGAA